MFSKFTRGSSLILVAAVGVLMLPKDAPAQAKYQSAQDAPPVAAQDQTPANSAQPVAQTDQPQTTSNTSTESATQTMSLGDIARMMRAKKESAPKAARVIDDENIPRNGSGISVVGGSGGVEIGASGPGRMTLLDFWASWCGPCRESVPDLKSLQRAYGSDQLEVISVNEDKNESAGRSFASQNGMNWNVQFDPKGDAAREHGVSAFPTFILLDENGHEVQRLVGEDPSVPLASRIAPFLKPMARKGA